MKWLLHNICMVILLMVTSGCMSTAQRFHECNTNDWACCVSPIREPHYIYPGTQTDLRCLAIPIWTSGDALYDGFSMILYPLFLVDLPLSIVTDTLFFPYDVYEVTWGGKTRYRKDIRENGNPNFRHVQEP